MDWGDGPEEETGIERRGALEPGAGRFRERLVVVVVVVGLVEEEEE